MVMHHRPAAEAGNREAFLVQLHALLTRVHSVVQGNAELKTIHGNVGEWLEELGDVRPPRPSPTPASGDASGSGTTLPTGRAAEAGAADGDAAVFGSRTIVDLVGVAQSLFVAGIPESGKLRAIGKAVVRLVMVRCTSAMEVALQRVARKTYDADEASQDDTAARAEKLQLFVLLSRDIRLSAHALVACLKLVTYSADLTDATSVRLPMQMSMDAARQVRRLMAQFQRQMEREELSRAQCVPAAHAVEGEGGAGALPVHATRLCAEGASATAAVQAEALREMWGPSLVRSMGSVAEVVRVAVGFLVSVSAIKEAGAGAELTALKANAQRDLFALCTRESVHAPYTAGAGSAPADRRRASSTTTEASAMDDSLLCTMRSLDGGHLEPSDAALVRGLRVAAALEKFGFSFVAEYLASVAVHCGDENDGQLVATSILADSLVTMDEAVVRVMTTGHRWKGRLFGGVLNCLVSLHPGVLAAGLESLGAVVAASRGGGLCQEVGHLYSSCVLPLLESENSPHYVKRGILLHILQVPLQAPDTPRGVPLLLQLYHAYDLCAGAQSLSVAQRLIAALSRMVRSAPCTAFIQDGKAEEHVVWAQGSVANRCADVTVGSDFTAIQSLPLMALHALVLVAELLAMQTPAESDPCVSAPALVPSLPNRELEAEQRRYVDVINSSPSKGVQMMFQVTDEEMHPGGCEAFTENWEHSKLPPPATEAVRQKAEAIARFLAETSTLSAGSVSEYLTTPAVLPLQVCAVYMSRLPLAGLSVVDALEELLAVVQLPREGQRIERLLEYFCGAYYRANAVSGVDPTVFPFETEDACFIVVVATVMLNTALRNPMAGANLSRSSFQSQLRGCNNNKDFDSSFVDDIFLRMSSHPFQTPCDTEGATQIHAAAAAVKTSRGIEALFISEEEQRQLAFGMERQRLVNDTKRWLHRCSIQAAATGDPPSWCAVARDFFLSAWSSECTVFDPSMCEGAATPSEVPLQCIKGLQALAYVAAAFALPTECEAMMVALLRMGVDEPVRHASHHAVLVTAATEYAQHFSARCWLSVVSLMVTLRMEGSAMHAEVEGVLGRIECFARRSCTAPSATGKAAATGDSASTLAVQRVLAGILQLLESEYASGGVGLTTSLYLLRRSLEYALIVRTPQSSKVMSYLNVRDLKALVLPRLVELGGRLRDSDDALRAVMGFVVHVLEEMWRTCLCAGDVAEVVECYSFFQHCYQHHASSTLVKVHVLQAVKELMSRTLLTAPAAAGGAGPTLYACLSAWRQLLHPLARVLSDRESAGSETSGLSMLILRKLVVLACDANSGAMSRPARGALLVLLSSVLYIGGMCSDIDSAHVCLNLLTTVCDAALHLDGGAGPPAPAALLAPGDSDSDAAHAVGPLLHGTIRGLREQPLFAAVQALQRLCLLLRCEREQTRTEAVESLRALSSKLHPSLVHCLAVQLCDVVLESTVGRAAPCSEAPVSSATLLSFGLLCMGPPRAMRLCSRTAFRTTLPTVLRFMSNEMLSAGLGGDLSGDAAPVIMERCLVPMIVSPNCGAFQTRSLAARSLAQCALHCQSRYSAGSPCGSSLRSLLNCISMVLFVTGIPVECIVPVVASFPGKHWAVEHAGGREEVEQYVREAVESLEVLARSDPADISGSTPLGEAAAAATLLDTVVEVHAPAGAGHAALSGTGRSRRLHVARPWSSEWRGGEAATDEQLAAYCTLLVQVLSALPKVIRVAGGRVAEWESPGLAASTGGDDVRGPAGMELEAGEPAASAASVRWAPPVASPTVLLHLLLEAAGRVFALLWRISHPREMVHLLTRCVQRSFDASAGPKTSALLPHAAVRGVLNSYLELALAVPCHPVEQVRQVMVGMLSSIAELQVSTQGRAGAEGDVELAAAQRLSPQEQQYIRACHVGMHQELAVVLSYWVRAVVHPADRPSLPPRRREEVEAMALDPRVFAGFVALLTPTAGAVITSARDYFAWYATRRHAGATLGPHVSPMLHAAGENEGEQEEC